MSESGNSGDKGLSILLVEDNRAIAENIDEHFSAGGHQLDFAYDGAAGVELALSQYYDLIILDVMLPKLDGWQVIAAIRERADRHIPVIMLTARDSVDDRVQGLELGADDYLCKPFALKELHARCLTLCNRHRLNRDFRLSVGPLTIDRRAARVSRDGTDIELNQSSYQILLLLAEAWPNAVSRSQITQKLWGDEPPESDALRSHIYQLRRAVDKPFAEELIETVHGVGFRLRDGGKPG